MTEQLQQSDYETTRYEGLTDDFNTILLRLDPSPTLETIRRFFLRQTIKQKDGSYKRMAGLKPMFKEEGIEELMANLYARMSVDKVLSNLKENDIRLIIRELGEVTIEFIYSNANKYKIKESDYNNIFYVVKHNVEIFLRRAKEGKENELLAKNFLTRESVSKNSKLQEETQPNNRSWF